MEGEFEGISEKPHGGIKIPGMNLEQTGVSEGEGMSCSLSTRSGRRGKVRCGQG